MAHHTHEQIDQAAAEFAAGQTATLADEAPAQDRLTLAYGAEGEAVTQLVNLLDVLGYNTNDVIKGGEPKIDESVLADVRAAQAALSVSEPGQQVTSEIPVAVAGELVGKATWDALYAAVEAKLQEPAPATAASEAAPADASPGAETTA